MSDHWLLFLFDECAVGSSLPLLLNKTLAWVVDISSARAPVALQSLRLLLDVISSLVMSQVELIIALSDSLLHVEQLVLCTDEWLDFQR